MIKSPLALSLSLVKKWEKPFFITICISCFSSRLNIESKSFFLQIPTLNKSPLSSKQSAESPSSSFHSFQQFSSYFIPTAHRQCDQIGPFLQSSCRQNFLAKVAQIFCNILGYYEKNYYLSENYWGYSWATFGIFGLLFIPIFDHTAHPRKLRKTIWIKSYSGADVVNKFQTCITTLLCNKAIRLDVAAGHVTSFNQSEFIRLLSIRLWNFLMTSASGLYVILFVIIDGFAKF